MGLGDETKAAIERYAREYFASSDAQHELREVEKAIGDGGLWENHEEWRVMTWSKTVIHKKTESEKDWYYVSVECDGQTLACRCPHLGRAHFFSRWYRHLIVYQFYSVGPTWGEVVKK